MNRTPTHRHITPYRRFHSAAIPPWSLPNVSPLFQSSHSDLKKANKILWIKLAVRHNKTEAGIAIMLKSFNGQRKEVRYKLTEGSTLIYEGFAAQLMLNLINTHSTCREENDLISVTADESSLKPAIACNDSIEITHDNFCRVLKIVQETPIVVTNLTPEDEINLSALEAYRSGEALPIGELDPPTVRCIIEETHEAVWKTRWTNDEGNQHKKRFFFREPRNALIIKNEIVTHEMTQVLTGHSQLNDFRFKIKKSETKSCHCEMKCEENILHFINECPTYATQRLKLRKRVQENQLPFPIPLNMYTTNNDIWNALMSFIHSTKRLGTRKTHA